MSLLKPRAHRIDAVETCKRRVALHVLKTASPFQLTNETIATAFGWTVGELLSFWREDKPQLVVKKKKK
jgi:hypothetical protein